MSQLTARASALLKSNTADRESTGIRKHHTPLLDRMGKLAKAGALGSMVLLAACSQHGGGMGGIGMKEGVGTVLGATLGGLAGSQIGGGTGKLVAVGVGTLLGAAMGNAAGASMDRADYQYAQAAEQRALRARVGETIRWNNPRSGNRGEYTPVREGRMRDGSNCREYQTTIVVGGQVQQGFGTACQQRNGAWRIVAEAEMGNAFAEVTSVAPGYQVAEAEPKAGPRLG